LESGEVLVHHPLPNNNWGEGLVIQDGHIVQLTWKSQVAYVYSVPDLKVVDHFSYQGEGWGLSKCNGGYAMSDGSSLLTFRNKQFDVVRELKVCSNMIPMRGLNDLQTVNDSIYSNVFYRDEILEINNTSGIVKRFIDCSELVRLAALHRDHILNGIAYNEDKELFYLTGKYWSELFVIEIPKTT
jgi:glutamine cyclotransferase